MSNRNRNAYGDNSPYPQAYRRWVAERHAIHGVPIRQIAQEENLPYQTVAGWHGAYKNGYYDRPVTNPVIPPMPAGPAGQQYTPPRATHALAPAQAAQPAGSSNTDQSAPAVAQIRTPQGTAIVPADAELIRRILGIQ